VNGITFSFPGSSYAAKTMQRVNTDGSLDLEAGKAACWSNGRVNLDPDDDNVDNWVNNSVYLTGAAPAQVKVVVTCKDFSDPATVTLPLVAHHSPVPEGAYRFPYAAGELRTDEYYETSAGHADLRARQRRRRLGQQCNEVVRPAARYQRFSER